MPIICPTVLADEPHAFREQMERIAPFAKRLQIDLTDGDFAPTSTVSVKQIWWPEGTLADIHMMYSHPEKELKNLIKIKPHLVIIHAEAETDHAAFAAELHENGIKAGLCVLKETTIESVGPLLESFDHLLIFGGHLGYFGGQADLSVVEKATQAKAYNLNIEIGWDGGVNEKNAKALADGGVDVLNVGGSIQKADNPAGAYATLNAIIGVNE